MKGIERKQVAFQNKIVILGFGSIGQAVLPLIFNHFTIEPSRLIILSKEASGGDKAQQYGIMLQHKTLTVDNFKSILDEILDPGDFLLNLSVDISSIELIAFCQSKHVLYLDTCTEPWVNGYVDPNVPHALRTNYALRNEVLKLKRANTSTAVITHGANPGLVSHFVKRALVNLAKDNHLEVSPPETPADWARLAQRLDIKTIQIAERDTQVSNQIKALDEFVNTWSVDGFIGEGSQPAELGWGTHEKHWPEDANKHAFGSQCAIYLNRPGASTKVRTWTPSCQDSLGFLITHAESISIAEYLTLKDQLDVVYRPTVHYAYVPCPDMILSLHELAGKEWQAPSKKRIMLTEIQQGMDELGVLLMGNQRGAYWYGSQLTIEETRALAPFNNATSLQVVSAVIAGMQWAMEHPQEGVVEPDELDYEYILEIAEPYLGKVSGYYTDWSPLANRTKLFNENIDRSDPWQFLNIRVI